MKMKTIRRAPAPSHLPSSCAADATTKASSARTGSRFFRGGKSLLRREEGQNLVEFAFVAPMLLLAVTGLLWFGIALNQYEVLTNAVANAARAFALSNKTSNANDPCNYAYGIATASASTLTTANMTFKVTYTPSGGTATNYTYPTTCSGLSLNDGDVVQVTATYPVTTQIFSWGSRSLTLTAQTSELVQ